MSRIIETNIPNIDWSGIESTEEAWGRALHQLLAWAERASRGNHGERLDVVGALTRFIAESPPGMGRLDEIARRSADALLEHDIMVVLERLASRSAELMEHLSALVQTNESYP